MPAARAGALFAAAIAAVAALGFLVGQMTAWAAVTVILWLALFRLWRSQQKSQDMLQKVTEEISAKYEAIVSALLTALGLRANMALQHSRRVSQLVSALGWQMGLRKQEVLLIEKAAIVHDVGKIGIAETVLANEGELTHHEWSEMKRHPELGYEILKGIKDLEDAADIVLAHHERWDGAGYPRGLRGEEIPVGARIFAVVDAYVAMTSHRPYRKAQPHTQAMQEILRNAGTQFDPEVVRAFRDAEERGLLSAEWEEDGWRPVPPAVPSEA